MPHLHRPGFLRFLLALQAKPFDGVLLEHFDRLRHRTDLVTAVGAENFDTQILLGEASHHMRDRSDRR